jgi:hypothetical protein
MSEKVDVIAEQVRLELLDQLRDLQHHGRRYIEEYTGAFLGPKTTWRPRPAFHPKLAELIRELVGEAALADRRTCGVTSSIPTTRDGQVSAGSPSRKAA